MKAIVMAGGFGTRIQPLTHSVPKPMLPILNRPMMQHIIEKLRDAGITEIVVLLYFKPEVISGYFGDGSELGVKIHYIQPTEDFGTAGAVKYAEKYLDDEFIIVSGDLVTDFDFNEVIAFHKAKNSKLTITLTPVSDPLQFGVVITTPEGKIQRFLEKPSWGEVFSDTVNTGIYILHPSVLSYIPEMANYDFGKDLFPNLMKENFSLWGCTLRGYWRDVGNPESYREVQKDLLGGKVTLSIRGEKQSVNGATVYLEEGASYAPSAKFEGTVALGKNVRIEGDVIIKDSVIGDKTIIKTGATIEDSVIWRNNSIGENSKLCNTVICDSNTIGKKVNISKGSIIAEGCEIGDLVSFERDVTVWPEKVVEEASIVSNNIVWGGKYKSSLFENGIVKGRTNVEFSCEMSIRLAESFASMLPVGGLIYVSYDYNKSSKMLKDAFLAGVESSGVSVMELGVAPSNIARFAIKQDERAMAGVHFRQSAKNQMETEALFFTNEGLYIDTNTGKNCERVFFRESFRRVNFNEIGGTLVASGVTEQYVTKFLATLNKDIFLAKPTKVVVDLLFGSTSLTYPEILNTLNIESVILNAYASEKRLSKVHNLLEKSADTIGKITQTLGLDAGFVVFPNGQRLDIVTNDGVALKGYKALFTIIKLLNDTAEKTLKVYLPVSAPDFLDSSFKNIVIERGKFGGFKSDMVKEYDFLGNLGGNYAFSEFAYNYDAPFACTKILELLAKTTQKLSDIANSLESFHFAAQKVPCPTQMKGKMMRKFMEASVGKEASFVDGIKIILSPKTWVLMLPDQHADFVHLFIQAHTDDEGEAIFKEFADKIVEWINE
ncbi:MAG: hypothetical protein RL154_548 [Pseudomonadota bacterium]